VFDLDTEAPAPTKDDATPSQKDKMDDKKEDNKRKRMFNEEDAALMTGMTDAIWGLNATVTEDNHLEVAPGIYEVVMGCSNFTRPGLMICLNHLMMHKGPVMVFVGMDPKDKEL
jgi:hypothetical protein